ncbi:T9SS type B sorting domain-containing protein [Formosa maritima]|uniref:T9SS type B sorting domain-containing protein n=1 Tax=Formosa maritima TaxID=2592046 RepID=A0A5D0GG67_9FLAO|nr:choice-of-anchor L domain-containing protein [Formosa maritima]TYA57299.1 T9SS type B sorting domain-containing protein [Formosa maritima]
MKKIVTLIIFISSFIGYSQIININNSADTESNYNLQQLVENVLISGDCADVDNFSHQAFGTASQLTNKSYGYFKKPSGSDFAFDEGIIITSGRAYAAGNTPINMTGNPDFNNNLPGDNDLESALGINFTNDATFIKFQFTPTSPDFNFRFIMASEEYDGNFECTYSDSFAFLLREVETTTYTNLAVLPDGTPVSVTSINNSLTCASNVDLFEGYNLPYTNYGGQTKVLTASAVVIPNQAYEIKLVVADQGDSAYDSAIFLEAGSFNIGLELGEDLTLAGGNPACSNDTYILDTQIPTSLASHVWYLNGIEIIGETNSTLDVFSEGTYSVVVDYGTNCTATDSRVIEFTNNPIANPIPNQFICDDNNDGFGNFNLLDLNNYILGNQLISDYTVSYHYNLFDAENDLNPIDDNYTNSLAFIQETLFARIEDNSYSCYNTTSFNIDVFDQPITTNYLYNLCDDGVDGDNTDGFTEFDLSAISNPILGFQDPSQFNINYFLNQEDADNNVSALPLLFTNQTKDFQDIIVRIENVDNINCYSTAIVTLHVLRILLDEKYVICLDALDNVIEPVNSSVIPNPPIETHYSDADYNFQWYYGEEILDSNIIAGATQSFYFPETTGFYTVNATDVISGCTIPATTLVVSSYPPVSISVEVISQAFENNNAIEITITGNGNYEISLDNGVWQSNTTFQNVSGGYHKIKVRDIYNCNELIHEITIMDYPKVFTPNHDGYNDTWNIYTIENQPDAKVYIYDRYGKLLKQLLPYETGWDGTFKGEPLHSDDYWFTIEYTDPVDQVKKQFKSHFTLKR